MKIKDDDGFQSMGKRPRHVRQVTQQKHDATVFVAKFLAFLNGEHTLHT